VTNRVDRFTRSGIEAARVWALAHPELAASAAEAQSRAAVPALHLNLERALNGPHAHVEDNGIVIPRADAATRATRIFIAMCEDAARAASYGAVYYERRERNAD